MNNQTPNQVIEQANQLIKAGQRDTAHRMLQNLVSHFPNEAQAWWLIANLTKDIHEKRYALEQILRIKPNSEKARTQLAEMTVSPMQMAVINQPHSQESRINGFWLLGLVLVLVASAASFFVGVQVGKNQASGGLNVAINPNTQFNTATNNNTYPPLYYALEGEWKRTSDSSILVINDYDETIRFFSDGTVSMSNVTGTYTFIDSSTMRIDFPATASGQVIEMSPIVNVSIEGSELTLTHLNRGRTTSYIRPEAIITTTNDDAYNITPSREGLFATDGNGAVALYIRQTLEEDNIPSEIPLFPIIDDPRTVLIATGSSYLINDEIVLRHYQFGLGIRLEDNSGTVIVSNFTENSTAGSYGLQLYDGIIAVNGVNVAGQSARAVSDLILANTTYNSIVNLDVMRNNTTLNLSIPRQSVFYDSSLDIDIDTFIKPGGLLYVTPQEPLNTGHYCLGAYTTNRETHFGCFTIP